MTYRPNGPIAMVRKYAASRPGSLISWAEAQHAYGTGTVKGYDGPRKAAAHHKMSVSNVLRRHFTKVEGARGLYVLSSSIANPDWDEDMEELNAFHAIHGCDEFGMSLSPAENALQRRIRRVDYMRMTDIGDIDQQE